MIPGQELTTMQRLSTVFALAVLVAVGFSASTFSRTRMAEDREAIQKAALDYVEGIYNVQPERIERSVHTTLTKRGFYKKDANAPYVEMPMTYDQLVNLARNWNKDGKRNTTIKNVEVLDLLDQTAVVKITASWGIDHMLLGKYDGKWKINLIQWQSPPPKS